MARKKQTREDELFAELIKLHGGSQEALLGPEGLLKQLTKRLVEQALQAELEHHLEVEREAGQQAREDNAEPGVEGFEGPVNIRNGSSRKTLHSEQGSITLDIPGTATHHSSRCWFPSINAALPGWTRRFWGCTRAE